jgi:hypothetical protein
MIRPLWDTPAPRPNDGLIQLGDRVVVADPPPSLLVAGTVMVLFGPHRVRFGMQLGPATSFSSQRHMRAPFRRHLRYMDIIGHGLVERRPDLTTSEDLGGSPVLYEIPSRTGSL